MSDKVIKYVMVDFRLMVFKENQFKFYLYRVYRVDEVDVLEGDDDEGDMLFYF